MDKDELSEKYVDILNAILVENEEEEEEEIDDESYALAHEARARITPEDIDVSDDVQALLSNEDQELSEDFKVAAATIFEAAVVSKINSEIDKLEEDFASEISEARATFEANLTEKVDGYLNYVVEEWMKENELAVERGVKTELTDDFITGLKNLFTEHYIEIPDEKVDVVDDLANRVDELEAKLNESIETNIDLRAKINGHEKEEIFHQLSNGLADTEREKLESLSEGVQYEDAEQYIRAIATLKESYFPQAPRFVEEEDTDELLSESLGTTPSSMDAYTDAIGRSVKTVRR
jgi:BMFP domain-containing protein YqiC